MKFETNVDMLPEGLIRLFMVPNIVPAILYFECYFLVWVPFYLILTVLSGYDPVKAFWQYYHQKNRNE
jgi:hypothetical protein